MKNIINFQYLGQFKLLNFFIYLVQHLKKTEKFGIVFMYFLFSQILLPKA